MVDRVPDHWRSNLVLGLAVVLPVALIALVVLWIGTLLSGVLGAVVDAGASLGLTGTLAAGGLVVGATLGTLLVLIAVGAGVRHRLGQRAVALVDRAVESLPAVGPIYRGLRRSRDVVAAEDSALGEVVRVELVDGVHALGFVVDRDGGDPTDDRAGEEGGPPAAAGDASDRDAVAGVLAGSDGADADELVTVFLPFAPNPAVGGHLFGVRTSRLEHTDLSVGEGLGILVGFGPQDVEPSRDEPLGSFYPASGTAEPAGTESEEAPIERQPAP